MITTHANKYCAPFMLCKGPRDHLDHLVYGAVEESPQTTNPRKVDDPVNFLLLALLHMIKIPFKTSKGCNCLQTFG